MNDPNSNDSTVDSQGNPIPTDGVVAKVPPNIGRYRIERVLGKGGFGLVYLAHDEQLNRRVAMKVPHAKLISKPEDAEAYLAEARTVANLDYPNIVPVYDVGSTEDCPCYVVSKYIEGTDLAKRLQQSRLTYREAAELVGTVAEALHYAHKQGLVHRDIKPGNLLLDKSGKPFVADFGLALRDENRGKGPRYAGTPSYWSPEQARGEGHRVEGRSDIFSLGVVFYELLAGFKPFRGDTQAELLEQITDYEPKPLLQYDEELPKELQRICFKALSKPTSDRYWSAHDMAKDLRHFLSEQTVIQSGASPGRIASVTSETKASAAASTSVGSNVTPLASVGTRSSDNLPIKIVPKGLRSFDAHDADFFLELLPGPRDREGLPASLKFWKIRIEEPDADNAFSVGLIYGPSGCGKSSLVKAGLLPRLSEDVITVYIEATPKETETRLLHGLRKRCPTPDDNLSLKDTLAALRRGQGIPVGKKVLIVLDQFEQWLHAKKEEHNPELIQALRQCDGGRVQCIVMVRDDFWMAATRFGQNLEVDFVPGNNMAVVDLFPIRHAEKVLAAFGRAFEALPDEVEQTSTEQKKFVKQSVAGLQEEGKVICVRLALFADMIKGKAWTPTTLKEVGGIKGIDMWILEETFSSQTAVPQHRQHQQAALAVLRALLPNSSSDIKGEMKSHAELLAASGYASRPKDFEYLIRILDSEIRLITPTDPEGVQSEEEERLSVSPPCSSVQYFQLTHDYLVPSLREWLSRKQRETRTGRAELKLEERSAIWNAKREDKQLPTVPEWISIRRRTNKETWKDTQRAMMYRAACLYYRWAVFALFLVIECLVCFWYYRQAEKDRRLERAVADLIASPMVEVKSHIKQLEPFKDEATEKLHTNFGNGKLGTLKVVHALIHYDRVNSAESQFLQDCIGDFPSRYTGYLLTVLSDLKAKNATRQSELERDLKDRIAQTSGDPEKQGRYLAVCVALGYSDVAIQNWNSESDRNNPSMRTSFIDMFHAFDGDVSHIAKLLENDKLDRNLRYALCASVGKMGIAATKANTAAMRKLYVEATDAGTHSAARWALIQHGIAEADLEKLVINQPASSQRDWYVCSSHGITMVKIPSGSFALGNITDRENRIEQKPTTFDSFWMSDREISVGHFEAIMSEQMPKSVSVETVNPMKPAANLTWFDAIAFCNRLSRNEGLKPYYEFDDENEEERYGQTAAKFSSVNKKGDGYRLPTEVEWEYACRTMNAQNYGYGNSVVLLPAYAVFNTKASVECGQKIPNVWGLFDMHGNVCEWCCDNCDSSGDSSVLRGGSFNDLPANLRSALRVRKEPAFRDNYVGFRISRTLTP